MAVTDENTNGEAPTDGSLTYGSMAGGNIITDKPKFQPPGSPTQQIPDSVTRPQPQPVPPQTVDDGVAGMNMHGGNLHAEGVVPRSPGPWTQANAAADGDGDSRWTTDRVVYDWKNI